MVRRELTSVRSDTVSIEAQLSRLTGDGVLKSWRRVKTYSRQRSWILEWPSGHKVTWGAAKVSTYIRGYNEGRSA